MFDVARTSGFGTTCNQRHWDHALHQLLHIKVGGGHLCMLLVLARQAWLLCVPVVNCLIKATAVRTHLVEVENVAIILNLQALGDVAVDCSHCCFSVSLHRDEWLARDAIEHTE